MDSGSQQRKVPLQTLPDAPGKLRDTGVDLIGPVPWGTHLCQFYQDRDDLLDILVPYFRAGLEENEFCMWVTAAPLTPDEAIRAMRRAMPDFPEYQARGQIEIIPHTEWYLKDGVFDDERVLQGWVDKLEEARACGFDGLRLTGNTFWLEDKDWHDFIDYENKVNNVIGSYRMIAICTYMLDRCSAVQVIDVVNTHQFALIKRAGRWEMIKSMSQQAAEQRLQTAELKYRTMFEQAPTGMLIIDPVTTLPVEFNRTAHKQLGYTREEFSRVRLRDYEALEKPEEIRRRIDELLATGERQVFETQHFTRDGERRDVLVSTQDLDISGSQRLYCVFRDITDIKKEEAELRETQRDLNRAQAVAQTGSWRLEIRKNELLWSDEVYRIFGIPAGTSMTYELFLAAVHPDDRGFVDSSWHAALKGEPYDIEHRIIACGELKWVRERAELECDEQGRVCSGFGTVQDITGRKQAEEVVQRLNSELRENTLRLGAANKDLEAFTYSVSHDLRAPLRAIDGFSQVLVEDYGGSLDAEGRRIIGIIRDNTCKMGQLIDDLLALSRVGRVDMEPVEVDVAGLAGEVFQELRSLEPERDIEFQVEPMPRAWADRAQLRLVLANLIANSIKFTRGREPARVELGGKTRKGMNEYYVRDNGAGFDMRYADKLFGVFQRLHSEREFEGTGVGLAIVKRIVKRHGGEVSGEGEPGVGATFYFTLPVTGEEHG